MKSQLTRNGEKAVTSPVSPPQNMVLYAVFQRDAPPRPELKAAGKRPSRIWRPSMAWLLGLLKVNVLLFPAAFLTVKGLSVLGPMPPAMAQGVIFMPSSDTGASRAKRSKLSR